VKSFDEEIDPLNPLPARHRFIKPEEFDSIASNTNENEFLDYEQKEKHTKWERSWDNLPGVDAGAFFGATMQLGVQM
jgi:hypothetical protein